MLRLERRPTPSALARFTSPLLAAAAMLLTGILIFGLLGKDPAQAFVVLFIKPLSTLYGVGEWLLKATPLLLCGLGLAIAYRANVWNIGAEGQLTLGAIAGSGVALWLGDATPWWGLPLMLIAGVAGGMAWAAIPAALRSRYNTSEILVTLMLVYVAQLLLSYLVHGPWRDPQGYNYPQSRPFNPAQLLPLLFDGARTTWAFVLALLLAALSWCFGRLTYAGYRMQVAGLAPAAAAYAGVSANRSVWTALLVSGATAGLAGICEVAGPIGELQADVSPGYGYAAIIVAWIGRLHPVGVVLGALLMSLLYLGGDSAQLQMGLPSAITGLFQGLLLFYLLAADVFIGFRLRWRAPGRSSITPDAGREMNQ